MRFATVEAIYEAALKDDRIYFISGDLGHMNPAEFRKNLAGRYFNAGMSEQNIIGMAAGLALSGKKVFVYSIVPFITLRCIEQIKIDMCIHNADVTVVGVGGGLAYGSAGATHYSIEEVAALRALPNMKIVCPANPMEAKQLTHEVIRVGGPAYIRIGRGKEDNPKEEYEVTFGKGAVLKKGEDASIIASGHIAGEALRAAELLEKKGIRTEVVNMHTVKPLDEDLIVDRMRTRKGVFTLEEHSVFGGLGGAVAEVVAEMSGARARFKRFGIQDAWPSVVGTQAYLRDVSGISAEKIAHEIARIITLS